MKKLTVLSLVAVLILAAKVQAEVGAACGQLNEAVSAAASVTPVSSLVIATPTPVPTVSTTSRLAGLSSPAQGGSVQVSPGGGIPVSPAGGGGGGVPCNLNGIIWHAENKENGETHGESPVGGLDEDRFFVGQIWTDKPTTERWTFIIRPHTVVWFRGHRGGTAWPFCGDEGAAWEDIKLQARQLEERDGPMTTGIVMLPDQAADMRLVVRVETKNSPVTSFTPSRVSGSASPARTVSGPAIVEIDLGDGLTGLIKVNVGKSFELTRDGTPFTFSSQAALDERWPQHREEFLKKHPDRSQISER